jgi:hypothetical protein
MGTTQINRRHQACAECRGLWDEYSAATHNQFKLEGKLRIAGLSRNHEAVRELIPQVQDIAQSRYALRQRIADHEAAANSGGDTSDEVG